MNYQYISIYGLPSRQAERALNPDEPLFYYVLAHNNNMRHMTCTTCNLFGVAQVD